MNLTLVGDHSNDLCSVLRQNKVDFEHCASAREAIAKAGKGAGIIILADGYPEKTTELDTTLLENAAAKGARLYVEFPARLPGTGMTKAGETRKSGWERAVVSSDTFGPELKKLRILMIHGCRFVDVKADNPHIALARVAGFDTAVFGLPGNAAPILFEHPSGNLLVATTKLSQFMTGRYAPPDAWARVWQWILGWLLPGRTLPQLRWTPTVRPS